MDYLYILPIGIAIFFVGSAVLYIIKLKGPSFISNPIPGVLRVIACSYPPECAIRSNCNITGVIIANGLPATPFNREILAKTSKWPQIGMELPIIVDQKNPQRVKILWDKINSNDQLATQQAQQIADAINKNQQNR